MTGTVYSYPRCSTCRKALRYLDERNIAYRLVDIVATPPTKTELRRMLDALGGDIRRLFNTSGEQYRKENLKTLLPGMTDAEAIDLLASNGKLIKRPFLLTKDGGLIGFREAEWDEFFS